MAEPLLIGTLIGAAAGVAAWGLWTARSARIQGHEAEAAALRRQLQEVKDERDAAREALFQEHERRVAAETRAAEADAHAAERFRTLSDAALKHNSQALLESVQGFVRPMEQALDRYERMMKHFESDREQKYGQIQGELSRMASTTDQLVAVLGNSRIRGQWGQKMAEDVLRLCGLQEGIHYHKERETASGRPDYTFLLPEEHRLFMDVKFPLDHYWRRFIEAQGEQEQQRCKEAFIKSVRDHLREMDRRAYGAGEQSVDYTILFIPNEQVYASVNEWMPQLIDECLQKKLILCGPWTLYAVVRIIHQAWQNYQVSAAVRDIVRAINGFMQDYSLFKKRFGELGELLEKLDTKYREIAATSAQRLDNKIRRIEDYRRGQNIHEELSEPDSVTLGQLAEGSAP